jgi:replicative DNA helicase Mcm
MVEEKKFSVEDVFKEYAGGRMYANEFLRKKGLSALDLALLKIVEHLGKCEAKSITPFLSGGVRVLGTLYNSTEKKYIDRISILRVKGLFDIVDRKDKKNHLQLSPAGTQMLKDFFEYMTLKAKNGDAVIKDTYLYERARKIVEENYMDELNRLASRWPMEKNLYLDYELIDQKDTQIVDLLQQKPKEIFELFRDVIRDLDIVTDISEHSERKFVPFIRVKNFPTIFKLPLAKIDSNLVGQLVSFEGTVVGKDTTPHSMVSVARFKCSRCPNGIEDVEQDIFGTQVIIPARCHECGGLGVGMQFLSEESRWLDFTRMEIQDNIDDLIAGNQVKNLSLLCTDDLVNKVEVGNKVEVTGILQLSPPQKKSNDYTRFVHVLSLELTEKDIELSNPSEDEKKQFLKLSKDPQLFEKMIASLAPSIFGQENVKEAVLLQIFGGRKEKFNSEGIRERSDSHILLIGDPSTAKSRLMKIVSRLVPKAFWASGKGASGCGLTATVTKDETNKGRFVVKAGAMVLANGGMLCVDEFDKMEEEDRTRMHDGMELQTIYITKADIIAKMRSETTVLAAANPKLSRFDIYLPLHKQFELPASLLSRFDLIFVMIDKPDPVIDRKIALKILQNHSFIPGIEDKTVEENKAPVQYELLKKYIAYARANIDPVIGETAQEYLIETYVQLRKAGGEAIHITTRQLEGLIRLCEASAKVRLSNEVSMEDVKRVVKIFANNVRDIASDPETGEIDIDRIMTSHPAMLRGRCKTVELIIREGCSSQKEIAISTVLKKAAEVGIDNKECREIIQDLKKNTVYQVRDNILKLID